MNTRFPLLLLMIVVLLLGSGGVYILFMKTQPPVSQHPSSTSAEFGPLNTTYTIEKVPTTLRNGKAETSATGTNILTSVFGQPVIGDLNGDGVDDAAFFITQNLGGSGTFFYVVAAVNSASGTVGTNAFFLGDRIAPENIQIQQGTIIANYADRKSSDPMTAQPSVGISAYLIVDHTVLKKTLAPTQTLTYLVSQKNSTTYCDGVKMDSVGYQKTITTEKSTKALTRNPTRLQIIKATLNLATTGMCRTVLNQLPITENDGTVTIPPMEGWAGISIAMCSCKPQVEVNLLRMPGIKKVIWQ